MTIQDQHETDDYDDNVVEEEEEELLPFRYSITSYGADYPIDGLVRRIADGSIIVPSFQRGFVWTPQKASRFIESLLLGLPVPGIFLSKDSDSQRLIVIDGQQRLLTLQYFYEGIFANSGKEFGLKGVDPQFEDRTYKTISEEDRRLLDDSILHATIVKQDEPDDGNSSIYQIFERINTGGMQLQSQEIRAAIFHGEFSNLLGELNHDKHWRELFGNIDKRMRDEELILRFIALYYDGHNYTKTMKEFLNSFMGQNRHLTVYPEEEIRRIFSPTVKIINLCIGNRAFKPVRSVRAALFDAIMIGIAKRLSVGPIAGCEQLVTNYYRLLENKEFIAATETSTSDENTVKRRLDIATSAFAKVD